MTELIVDTVAVGDWSFRFATGDEEENSCARLAILGGQMLKSEKLGHMEWEGRPLTNLEMHAMRLAARDLFAWQCDRWCRELVQWLDGGGTVDLLRKF